VFTDDARAGPNLSRVGSRDRSEHESNVVRSMGWNAVTAGVWGVAALLCLAWAANASGLAARIVLAALAAGCLWMVFRTVVAGAETGPDGVIVRGFFRTRLIPWTEIAEVGPSRRGGSSCVALRLRNGQLVQVRGCAAYSTTKLREFARAISGARPTGVPVREWQSVRVERTSSGGARVVRQWWFLVGLPLLAVPLGIVFVAAFSYWPGVALSIGGAAVAAMNYRRVKTHRP